jgi:hypothetical protein
LPDQRLFVPSAIIAPLVKKKKIQIYTLEENGLGKTIEQILFYSQAPHPLCPSKC